MAAINLVIIGHYWNFVLFRCRSTTANKAKAIDCGSSKLIQYNLYNVHQSYLYGIKNEAF